MDTRHGNVTISNYSQEVRHGNDNGISDFMYAEEIE